ncbi:hypothetical protein BDA99DRAFT_511458 [Phascolomyces articulosus]|uniref:Uncharacterized protein n=1 Tax=Phascolomyces articulosus TaxID=60185 RepID=A0AAD5PD41_9FUNG|nr:hypothetical protein BDA99DRAFT_511458 [Phascolomyces articulosus]
MIHVNQKDLLFILNQHHDHDLMTLNTSCQQAIDLELEHKPQVYTTRLIVLDFLCRQLQPNAPLLNWALCFIGQRYCLTSILFADPSFDSFRQKIFHQCFNLLETEAYRDLQTHRLLYDLLSDLRMPSCAWLLEIEASLHMQYQYCLQQCEQILENQVIRPSLCTLHGQQWIENIPSNIMAKSVSIQIRLALYQELQPVEMTPLLKHLKQMKTYEPRECFQLSSSFRQFIQVTPLLLSSFNNEIDSMTEQFFAADEKLEALCLDEALLKELKQQPFPIHSFSMDLLNECFQILGSVPSRFMPHITLINISLMQTFLQFHHNQDITWDECCRLCDSAWGHAFASLLDRAMFENCPASESIMIRSLAKLCSCSILVYHLLDIQYSKQLRIQLWKRYSDHRTLFIQSFDHDDTTTSNNNNSSATNNNNNIKKRHSLARDLTIVQRLLFT